MIRPAGSRLGGRFTGGVVGGASGRCVASLPLTTMLVLRCLAYYVARCENFPKNSVKPRITNSRAITVSVWDPRAPIPTSGAQRVWMGGGLPPERAPPGPLGGRSGEVRALTALFTPVWAVGGGGLRRPPRPGLGSVWGRYGGGLVCSHTCPSAVGGRGTPPSADRPYPVWGRSGGGLRASTVGGSPLRRPPIPGLGSVCGAVFSSRILFYFRVLACTAVCAPPLRRSPRLERAGSRRSWVGEVGS